MAEYNHPRVWNNARKPMKHITRAPQTNRPTKSAIIPVSLYIAASNKITTTYCVNIHIKDRQLYFAYFSKI